MAKSHPSNPRGVSEYHPAQSTGEEATSTASQQSRSSGDVLEFDPNLPSIKTAAVQATETVDTLVPHADLFSARDALEQLLGGRAARIAAFSATNDKLAGRENIVGFGVGFRYTANNLSGDVVAKVYVKEKLPLRDLSPNSHVPPAIDGIPTDVEQIGEAILHSYAKRYPRPVPCGVTVSNIGLNGSGTLGCLVILNNNKLCILSNNHVLANENAAAIGSDIIQPGNAEPAPAPDQVIGSLENFVRINATGNLVDAAVAWTSYALSSPTHITYKVNPSPLGATLGMTVLKNGRTTQSTIGTVTEVGVNISVPYDPFPAGAEMNDQIGIRGVSGPFSMPGDSGSLIVTNGTKQPVALLFAGSTDNSITFGNPIQAVITALGIREFVAG